MSWAKNGQQVAIEENYVRQWCGGHFCKPQILSLIQEVYSEYMNNIFSSSLILIPEKHINIVVFNMEKWYNLSNFRSPGSILGLIHPGSIYIKPS